MDAATATQKLIHDVRKISILVLKNKKKQNNKKMHGFQHMPPHSYQHMLGSIYTVIIAILFTGSYQHTLIGVRRHV